MNTETNDPINTAITPTALAKTPLQLAIAKLIGFDIIMVVDASGSMGGANKEGSSVTRWDYMQETAIAFARDAAAIDEDGFGLVVFSGNGITSHDNCKVDDVTKIFKERTPRGTTPLAEALTAALKLGEASTKKKMIVVYTDGVPDDDKAAAKVIIDQANKQATDEELTFLFVQVGTDTGATAYLKSLDDDLTKAGAKFDIVDTKTIEEADKFNSTVELLANAIDD
jgi:Mg-chelatase subunit ChlD